MQESGKQDRRRVSKIGRWIAFFLVLSVLGGIGMLTLRKNSKNAFSSEVPREMESYEVWQDEVIEISRNMAVQDGGRVKPFSTWAGFTALKLRGTRSMKILVEGEEVKLEPEDIMLDCLFRPELAKELAIFRIDNSNILTGLVDHGESLEVPHAPSIGDDFISAIEEIKNSKDRRDRYSYNELADIVPVLLATAEQMRTNEPNKAKMTIEVLSLIHI